MHSRSSTPLSIHSVQWSPFMRLIMLSHYLLLAVAALLVFSTSPTAASLVYDPSTPLLLDSYLSDSASRAEGRELSLVTTFPTVFSSDSPTTSTTLPFDIYTGFFSITPTCSLFFQLFSPQSAAVPSSSLPLIISLAGGPGLAATYWTLYGGQTPLTFTVSPSPRLLYHNQSWAEDAHVLLIDSPISVGFSQCSSNPILAANNSQATAHLVTFMNKFLTLFPDFTTQPIYVAGHSYGGRSAPDLAAALSLFSSYSIAGAIIESGLTQWYLSFSETCNGMYQQGLFNHTERRQCNIALEQMRAAIDARDEASACNAVGSVAGMVIAANGGNPYQDWERTVGFTNMDTMVALLNTTEMRLALHTGLSTPYAALPGYSFTDHCSGESVTGLDTVLSESGSGRVLYFASNKDSLLATSTQRLLAATQYNQRTGWNQTVPVALQLAGTNGTRGMLKTDTRLWFATVYNAGHMISITQPALSRQLIANFTRAAVTATATSASPQATPSTALAQWQKLLPPLNRQSRPLRVRDTSAAADVSPAVYLTPYLSLADGPAMAQQASAVSLPHSPLLAPNSTYSGYITIDPKYNSNSFFWFLPSLDHNESAPLILHLSGGPGISSMAMGFLYQHGPFAVDFSSTDPLDTVYRPDNFNEHAHVLYVDNPIGTGFSYTESQLGFRNNSRQVAEDLYELLRQFYLLFPTYRHCRMYVHGVSYAGHFLPTLGWKIHHENGRRGPDEQITFEGLFIASGWMDPPSQTSEEVEFFQSIGRMDLTHTDQLVACSGTDCDLDLYNYVHGDVWELQEARIMAYLSHPSVVSALHAGDRGLAVQSSNDTVTRALRRDPSVRAEVEELLASGYYHVVMYTAEYDVVCAASGVTNFIASLDYTRKSGWEQAVSKEWWKQPTRPASQSRQPPHTTPLQPWQPQPQGIWWSSSPRFTLHHAMIRFAGHLVEQTHLYQAGQIIARVQSWPTLPKSGGEDEKEGFAQTGVGRAFIALIILCIVFGLGAFLDVRQANKEKASRVRSGRGAESTLSTSLLGDDDKYSNATL